MSSARHFGSGVLIATPSSANPTPVEFGVLQEVSLDFSSTIKPLMGQFQMPVAQARGALKISGKAKFAELNGPVFSSLFFGATPTKGQFLWAYNEAGSVPAVSTYTVTVTNSSTWTSDLGVKYATTGLSFTRVASAPTVGQYSVAAGVYTFAAADASAAVLISYQYSQTTSGSGSYITIGNPLMGVTPNFQIDFYQTNPNAAPPLGTWSYRLFACVSSKLSVGSKLEDWNIPEFDFEAFANSANQIGQWNTAV